MIFKKIPTNLKTSPQINSIQMLFWIENSSSEMDNFYSKMIHLGYRELCNLYLNGKKGNGVLRLKVGRMFLLKRDFQLFINFSSGDPDILKVRKNVFSSLSQKKSWDYKIFLKKIIFVYSKIPHLKENPWLRLLCIHQNQLQH